MPEGQKADLAPADWTMVFSNNVRLLRDLSIVAAICLYFAGFAYYYFYCDALGLPFNLTGVSFYELISYSFAVVQIGWLEILFLIFLYAAALLGLQFAARRIPAIWVAASWAALSASLVVLLICVLYGVAYRAATMNATAARDGDDVYPVQIEFSSLGIANGDRQLLSRSEHRGRLFMLRETDDAYYLLAQSPAHRQIISNGRTTYQLDEAHVFVIPKREVNYMIERLDRACFSVLVRNTGNLQPRIEGCQ